jgi:signal transduction histidine kinase/DNA-binding response OmpR family regulator
MIAAPNKIDATAPRGDSPHQGGELRTLIRQKDWSRTPIGPIEQWSPALRMMVDVLLANRFPLLLWWGPEYISIYNDAYRPILGTKHPNAVGMPFREVWPEIEHVLGPLIDTPFKGGPATWMEDILLEVNRHGFYEETHFAIAYSPVPDDTAPRGIGGVLATVHETTEKVVGERRIAVLRDLGARTGAGRTAEEACSLGASALQAHAKDIPFALFYLLDANGGAARLAAAAGATGGELADIGTIELRAASPDRSVWPLAEAFDTRSPVVVEKLDALLPKLPAGPWSDPPTAAVVLPVRSSAPHQLVGFLVAGVSPRLQLDEQYRGFLDLVAAQVSAGLASARAYEEERRRAEALAEIDRAKTLFFSNVSHEFRTPLSLVLGPLGDAMSASRGLEGAQLELVYRNSLRLLRLVNSLLDFSRIQAGRAEATYHPVDLAALTAELTSNFRSACEGAGLILTVDCRPLSAPVHVDADMWEKIVLNLLSNAFKFTFNGEIEVALRESAGFAVLSIRDTGVGIPEPETARLFERFHRIAGQKSRTHEGSGIGLALVLELVKLHGGTIQVESAVDRGTTFTVRLPFGSAHLPADRVAAQASPASTSARAQAFVQEALRWLPGDDGRRRSAVVDEAVGQFTPRQASRVLLADDNADMREYVRRLLGGKCEVRTVADGAAALRDMQEHKPDLVLADVMMPQMDGFELLRQIRADRRLRDIPVILLSARAGEESRVEGLDAGANDYLVKPFPARELIARVTANLELAKLRAETTAAVRASEQRYRALVEAGSYAVYRMSPDWTEMLHLDGQGFIADTRQPSSAWLQSYIHPDDRAPTTAAIERAIATRSMFELEHRVRRVDGSPGWAHSRAVPIVDENGDIIEWFGAASDITGRKCAEEALRDLNENLERRVTHEIGERAKTESVLRQSQKMESIGQLTGGIAHDFNNLLTAIGGSLSFIERRLADGRDGTERYIRAAQEAVRRAATLTQRLLAFSRQQNLDPKPTDANKLIAGMEDLIRRTVGPDVEVEVVGTGGLRPVKVDPSQLENSLLNLCINARDAMAPDGGHLTIETANKWLDERAARERDVPPGQFVSICVTDTGSGMAPDVIEKAFEPFFTTKPVGQGTGLGLSMVYGFVRQSGGQVRIYSELGKGTTMCLYLPRHMGEAEDRADAAAASRIAPGDGETVLVVDDEPTLRMLMLDALEEHGYKVLLARDGATALEFLESDLRIDLLITDVGLPGGMNGRQIADEARKLRPDLRILFITGFAENAAVRHGHLDPGMQVLAKPFDIVSLAAKVRALVEQ